MEHGFSLRRTAAGIIGVVLLGAVLVLAGCADTDEAQPGAELPPGMEALDATGDPEDVPDTPRPAEPDESINPQYEQLGNAAPGCQLGDDFDAALRPVLEADFGGAKLVEVEHCQEDAVQMTYVVPQVLAPEAGDIIFGSLRALEAIDPLQEPEYDQTTDIVDMVFNANIDGQYNLVVELDVGEQRIRINAAQP